MIYSLRKKFIFISALSVLLVLLLISVLIYFIGISQLNRTMDELTDAISPADGFFPSFSELLPSSDGFWRKDSITPETQFSTRFFTVWANADGEIIKENIERISSVTTKQARSYAEQVFEHGKERGWIGDYRYKLYETRYGKTVIFVNGEANKSMTVRLLSTAFAVLLGSGGVILLLIILISKYAVKPAAESYEKQKQFITDANHELKTPLTLILTNLDIAEAELGKNEWLDDIRSEGERMTELVNQLVALSRMDEIHAKLNVGEFDLSETVSDTASEFIRLASERSLHLSVDVVPNVLYTGDEALIRRLLSILLDNAVKYCDAFGEIRLAMYTRGGHPVLTVENTYRGVNGVELGRLFDRFYRADKARTASGSFGVGLSIAKGIARNHRGDVTAYQKDQTHIGFKVILK